MPHIALILAAVLSTGVEIPDEGVPTWKGGMQYTTRAEKRPAAITNEAGACFAPLVASAPSWLYGADWDLLRVTRRGVDAAGEAVGVECLYQFFRISIR